MATVDIIIPVYNRAEMVREAIESALNASPDVSVEIVVVDDASTDGTWDCLRAYDDPRIRCFRMESNSGQCAARNRGLDAARGTWVKFLDSDDVLIPGHLSAEVRALQTTGAEIAVSGWCADSNGKPRPLTHRCSTRSSTMSLPVAQCRRRPRCIYGARIGVGIRPCESWTTGTVSVRRPSEQIGSRPWTGRRMRCANMPVHV